MGWPGVKRSGSGILPALRSLHTVSGVVPIATASCGIVTRGSKPSGSSTDARLRFLLAGSPPCARQCVCPARTLRAHRSPLASVAAQRLTSLFSIAVLFMNVTVMH